MERVYKKFRFPQNIEQLILELFIEFKYTYITNSINELFKDENKNKLKTHILSKNTNYILLEGNYLVDEIKLLSTKFKELESKKIKEITKKYKSSLYLAKISKFPYDNKFPILVYLNYSSKIEGKLNISDPVFLNTHEKDSLLILINSKLNISLKEKNNEYNQKFKLESFLNN